MHLSVTPRPQNALLRRMRFSSPGQTRRRLTEKRTLAPVPHVKAHSVPTASRKGAFWKSRPHGKAHSDPGASRKSALWMRTSPKDALWMRAATQNALFRNVSVAECTFPSHRDRRMRFYVECTFPHLRKRGAGSRKSAFCVRCLTEKRILQPVSHVKAHSVPTASRKSALCLRTSPKDALCMKNTRASRAFSR